MLPLWRKAHCEKLPSMAGSAGGYEEVGKREAWTPQPMICSTQVNIVGSSLGNNTRPENEEIFTELADQLRIQCLRETVVIPQRSTQGSTGYDISAACSCVIPSKGKGVVQTRLAVSLPLGVYARIARAQDLQLRSSLTWAKE